MSAAKLRAKLTPTSAPERRRFRAQIDGIVQKHLDDAVSEIFVVAAKRLGPAEALRCRSSLDLLDWFAAALADRAQRYRAAIGRR